jgi:hypothetical protein
MSVSLVLRLMVAVRMKVLIPLENAALLTGS